MDTRPNILIAEDDLEDRLIMAQTFDELGSKAAIKLVEDGISLIEYLVNNGTKAVNLIVLDLNMPRMNGTETLRKLKEEAKYRHIPVIIFSTSVNEIEKAICLSLGAQEYITKPSRYSEYLDACKRFNLMADVPAS